MEVTLMNDLSDAEERIEWAARVCYDSKPKEDRGSFLKRIIEAGHESVVEHASATFLVEGISRACSHQLVRHRIASYSQRSQRYVKESGFGYVIPASITEAGLEGTYVSIMAALSQIYRGMVEGGIPKEDARYVLPNACLTRIMVTMNMRELRHFIRLRSSSKAQWEIRKLAERILNILKGEVPNLVYDL